VWDDKEDTIMIDEVLGKEMAMHEN